MTKQTLTDSVKDELEMNSAVKELRDIRRQARLDRIREDLRRERLTEEERLREDEERKLDKLKIRQELRDKEKDKVTQKQLEALWNRDKDKHLSDKELLEVVVGVSRANK